MKVYEDKKMSALELYNKQIVDDIIRDYQKLIREELLAGKEVSIPEVGKLVAMYRKVKNPYGREYTVRVRLIPERSFTNDLVKEYEKDPTRFKVSKGR